MTMNASPWDFVGSAMHPVGQEQLQYDSRGRLMPFVETQAQRRERERLLKRKEHARRVNKWLEESSVEAAKVLMQMNMSTMRTSPSPVGGRRFHLGDRPDSIMEEDEMEEPYILYSTSPSTSPYGSASISLSLSMLSSSPSSSSSSVSSGRSTSPFEGLKASSRKSSRSSLGSIVEEPGLEGSEGSAACL
ncbi:hypothetical protein BXZ70DRAFT_643388 [Cristinia sonorae]|uniref:Uncharacterized protein n=1 Tax=Cristinia sonorae TaxID=1940300 RepID=A0A8K0XK82_9AGAR|nr:hypothetical protein BXZ70DRAFT_643388 [Cristinia sonorae]